MLLLNLASLLVLAQAEPAPPPSAEGEAPVVAGPAFRLGLAVGPAWRFGGATDPLPRALGVTLQAAFSYRYLTLGDRFELGTGFHFSHQRYSKCAAWLDVVGTSASSCLRKAYVRHGDFLALQTLAMPLGVWRPQVGLGVGFGLAEQLAPDAGDAPPVQGTRLAVRASLGVARKLLPEMDLALELSHSALVRGPRRDLGAGRRAVFPGRQAISIWVIYVPDLGG